MTAKEYLRQIEIIDMKVSQKIEELNQMRDKVTLMSGIDYSRDRVQTTPTTGNKQIEALVDFEAKVWRMVEEETYFRNEIVNQIQTLTNPLYVDILYRRYVQLHSLERIACDMNYSYKYICNVHGKALQAFQKDVNYCGKK